MTPERWQLVKGVFDAAMERAAPERRAFVAAASGGNAELQQDVESLLDAHDDAGSRYDAPVIAGDPLIGREMGAYRILRRLGAGGMGAVYLGARADNRFRRLVAIKAIRADAVDAHTARRFENERHTLAALEHPNIVRLLDGGATSDNIPFLVMDYVEGQPIDRYCRDRNLTIAERLALFRQLCGAVHYAHQNLVVHRDLKPANILVTPQGVPKLLDFGIAKLLRPEYAAGAVGYTRTAAQPMTPEYASPEQILGQPVTTASDVYALGVLLYTLLTDSHPFQSQGASSYEVERAICETEARNPSAVAPADRARELRGDLDTIVLTAMRKEPQRRYASAEHLSEDIRRYLVKAPVLARGDSSAYRVRKFIARHRIAVFATLSAVALLVWLGVSAELGRRRSERLFGELRSMANFVIDDLDPQMQKSLLDARRAVTDKAVTYLDGLAKQANGDPALQLEAANGYRHIADLQGNLFYANLGRSEDAVRTANKALQFAQAVWNRDHANAKAREVLARSHQSVGALLQARGDLSGALDHYQKAIDLAGHDPAAITDLWSNIAHIHAQEGNPAGAAESYRKIEALLSEGMSSNPGDRATRKQLAFVREQIAAYSMLAGESAERAEQASLSAIAVYEEVPARSRAARRNLAMAYKRLAEAQKRVGKLDLALSSVRKSLADSRKLLREDPNDLQSGQDISQELVLLIDVLQLGGHWAEARTETTAALAWLKPRATLDSFYLENCVTLLVKTPFKELRDPGEALPSALNAVARDRNPETLDLLARAYAQAGKISEAIVTERSGIALLPPPIPGHPVPENRREMEAFLSALPPGGAERDRETNKAAR